MKKVLSCTTPKEAWSLFFHFTNNILQVIDCSSKNKNFEVSEEGKIRHDNIISDEWARLIGYLHAIKHRMERSIYNDTALQMQKIIDLATILDLSDTATHFYIKNHMRELEENWKKSAQF